MAMTSLTTALKNLNHPASEQAAYWLGVDGPFKFGTNIVMVIPPLIDCTTDANSHLAKRAVKALGKIGREPQITIPARTIALQYNDVTVRGEAVNALWRFGDEPALRLALKDPEQYVRRIATNALYEISQSAQTNRIENK